MESTSSIWNGVTPVSRLLSHGWLTPSFAASSACVSFRQRINSFTLTWSSAFAVSGESLSPSAIRTVHSIRSTTPTEPQAKAKRKPDNELLESNNIPTKLLTGFPVRYTIRHQLMAKRTYPSIAARMADTGETQAELAEILGVSQPYMSKIVRGLQQPGLDEALRIARIMRVPVESLVARERSNELTVGK
jgi:DNA-binding XRE family transcriptional regulator